MFLTSKPGYNIGYQRTHLTEVCDVMLFFIRCNTDSNYIKNVKLKIAFNAGIIMDFMWVLREFK